MSDRLVRAAFAGFLLVLAACEREEPARESRRSSTATSRPTDSELASVREFLEATAPQRMPAGHPLVQPPAEAPVGSEAAPPMAALLRYEAPAGWQQEPVRSSMRRDQYRLPRVEGDDEDGLLTVFHFGPGGGGGVEANVERWRGQFSGADGGPVADDAFSREETQVGGLKITVVEVRGRFGTHTMGAGGEDTTPVNDYALLGAIVETPAGPWFFKALGPAATIEKHRAGFMELLRSMRVE